MPKQSRLPDDAAIFNPKPELSEKEKLGSMTLKQKMGYLWEYYRLHALIFIIAVGFIIYMINEIITPNIETRFNAAILNNCIPDEVWKQYETDFFNYLKLDPETEEVRLNYSYYFNGDKEYAMNMQQALATYVAASEIDVIIAPEAVFKDYTYYGFMDKLNDDLPTDLYSGLTEDLFVSTTEEDAEDNVYGIYLTDTKLFRDNASSTEPYVLGIIANSKRKDTTIEFIRMLFDQK